MSGIALLSCHVLKVWYMVDTTIIGLSGVHATLAGVPDKLAKNALRAGLRQAANLIRDAARANFNTGGGPNDITGALKASIRTVSLKGSPTRIAFGVAAGALTNAQKKKFGIDSTYYAVMVEYGHLMRGKGDALKGGTRSKMAQRFALGKVGAASVAPRPFMRPALEKNAQAAIDMVAATVADKLSDVAA